MFGSFHFDDYSIFSDTAVTAPGGVLQLLEPLRTRPLTYFTLWLNFQTGGRNPIGYHAVNLLLHLAAVTLALAVFRRLMPARAAFIAAALFAIHPLQSEAVNYVFARSSMLAAVFCLAALHAWLCGRQWIAVPWFALALLSKEECVAFPLVLVLLHLSISRNRREWRPVAAMLGLSLLAGLRVLLAVAHTAGSSVGQFARVSRMDYFWSEGPAIWRYLRLIVIPWGFTVDPDLRVDTSWFAWMAWAALVGLCWLAARRFTRAREGFWFLAGLLLLLPSSSVFPASDLAADHRTYLAFLGLAGCAGVLAQRLPPRVLWIAGALLLCLSIQRTLVWRTEESLWTDAVEKAPSKLRPKIQLARAVDPQRALAILHDAQTLAPDDPLVPSEVGHVYLSVNRPELALGEFGRALALAPSDPRAFNNRGVALLKLGQREAARQDFERSLKLDPCQADARANLKVMGSAPKR